MSRGGLSTLGGPAVLLGTVGFSDLPADNQVRNLTLVLHCDVFYHRRWV